MQIDLTKEEAETIIFSLKVVKHFLPEEVNREHKELYDKLRPLLWKPKEYIFVNK